MNYKVTYPVDSIDSKPTERFFETQYDAEEWLFNEVQRRMDYTIQHSPYTISEKEYAEIEEYENSLIHIEDLNLGL